MSFFTDVLNVQVWEVNPVITSIAVSVFVQHQKLRRGPRLPGCREKKLGGNSFIVVLHLWWPPLKCNPPSLLQIPTTIMHPDDN